MHTLEPYYAWRNHYIASNDARSPFHERQYSEFEYSTKIYNYYIHPQWDSFQSQTLFCKILFADYDERFFAAAASRGFEAGRTQKHVATPVRGSATKRLNMFLRWMVRSSARGVDFGVWSAIEPRQLMIPLDVHTGNVGRKLQLLHRNANDWRAVEELMSGLRQVDARDPVRLDFALFGLGAIEGF